MKIGILQCDSVLEHFQPDFGDYPEMFEALLTSVAPECQFKTYRVQAMEYPRDLDECDGYITTGSRHSVYDDLPWIRRLEDFIRELDRAKKKYVGICFGHQLLAKALGGTVAKSEKGWGVGVSSNQVTTLKPWMSPDQETLDLIVSHQDQIECLPSGLEVLASSDFCPYYMLQYGEHFMSIQGHPEFSKAYSRALMDHRRKIIPQARLEAGIESLKGRVDDLGMTQWIVNFFTSEQCPQET